MYRRHLADEETVVRIRQDCFKMILSGAAGFQRQMGNSLISVSDGMLTRLFVPRSSSVPNLISICGGANEFRHHAEAKKEQPPHLYPALPATNLQQPFPNNPHKLIARRDPKETLHDQPGHGHVRRVPVHRVPRRARRRRARGDVRRWGERLDVCFYCWTRGGAGSGGFEDCCEVRFGFHVALLA